MAKSKTKPRPTASAKRKRGVVRKSAPRHAAPVQGAPITPEFEVFALRVAGRAAVDSAAKKLHGRWEIRALSEARGEYQLVPGAGGKRSAAQAWEQARALRTIEGIVDAEPQFSYAGLEPDPDHLSELLAPHEMPPRGRRASGLAGHKPLPCAAIDPQWSVKAVKADTQWGTSTGAGVLVGHPDTGYSQHPELWQAANNPVLAAAGYDFLGHKPDPYDPLTGKHAGHGTATASVLMSPMGGPNNPFVIGTAPAAHLVPLRVSDSVIHFSFANLTQAIYHAVDKAHVQVISMSLGGPFPSAALERAILYARDKGVVCLAAAGNQWPFVVYPAKYAHVLAVAASNCQSKKWSGSASGAAVDISAPGESVWRAQAQLGGGAPAYNVAPSSGTSYAVATTAGICALWIAKHGHAALVARYGAGIANAFRQVVIESGYTRPAGWDARNMGAGIVDAQKVLAAQLPAAGIGARSRAPRGVMEIAVDYFPALDPDQALTAITAGVKRRGRQAVQAAFDTTGDELLFQLGTNPKLRAQIYARAAGRRQAVVRPAPVDGSRALRRAFGW